MSPFLVRDETGQNKTCSHVGYGAIYEFGRFYAVDVDDPDVRFPVPCRPGNFHARGVPYAHPFKVGGKVFFMQSFFHNENVMSLSVWPQHNQYSDATARWRLEFVADWNEGDFSQEYGWTDSTWNVRGPLTDSRVDPVRIPTYWSVTNRASEGGHAPIVGVSVIPFDRSSLAGVPESLGGTLEQSNRTEWSFQTWKTGPLNQGATLYFTQGYPKETIALNDEYSNSDIFHNIQAGGVTIPARRLSSSQVTEYEITNGVEPWITNVQEWIATDLVVERGVDEAGNALFDDNSLERAALILFSSIGGFGPTLSWSNKNNWDKLTNVVYDAVQPCQTFMNPIVADVPGQTLMDIEPPFHLSGVQCDMIVGNVIGIELENNGLSGSWPPPGFNAFRRLRTIRLKENAGITGVVQDSDFILFPHITTIDLSSTSVSGALPSATILLARDLTWIQFEGVSLTGCVPTPVYEVCFRNFARDSRTEFHQMFDEEYMEGEIPQRRRLNVGAAGGGDVGVQTPDFTRFVECYFDQLSLCDAEPPELTTAQFSDQFGYFDVFFSRDTEVPNKFQHVSSPCIGTWIFLKKDGFGSEQRFTLEKQRELISSCHWVADNTLRVYFDPDSDITNDYRVEIVPYNNFITRKGVDSPQAFGQSGIYLPSPYPPQLDVTGQSLWSKCVEEGVLNAVVLGGAAGKALDSYTWEVNVDGLGWSPAGSGPTLVTPRSAIPITVQYADVRVSASNWQGASGTSSGSFRIIFSNDTIIPLRIAGDAAITRELGDALVLDALAEIPPTCATNFTGVSFHWKVYTGTGGGKTFNAGATALAAGQGSKLLIPAGTLPPPGTYTFEAIASSASTPLNSTAFVEVTFVASDPVLVVKPVPSQVVPLQQLTFDATQSCDPNVSPTCSKILGNVGVLNGATPAGTTDGSVTLNMICEQTGVEGFEPCEIGPAPSPFTALNPAKMKLDDAFFDAARVLKSPFRFTAVLSSSTTAAQSTREFVVEATSVQVPVVSIQVPQSDGFKIPSDQLFTLRGSAISRLTGSRDPAVFQFAWTVVDASTDDAIPIQSNGPFLFVPPNSLSPGGNYKFRLEATEGAGVVGFAEVALGVNGPPQGGSVSVTPSSGVASVTEFTISTSGWIDDDGPLKYVFALAEPGRNGGQPIGRPSENPSLTTTLPMPRNGDKMYVAVTAVDALGSSTVRLLAVPVTLTAPSVNEFSGNKTDEAFEALLQNGGRTEDVMRLISTISGTVERVEDATELEIRELKQKLLRKLLDLDDADDAAPGGSDPKALDDLNLRVATLSAVLGKGDVPLTPEQRKEAADLVLKMADRVLDSLESESGGAANNPNAGSLIPTDFAGRVLDSLSSVVRMGQNEQTAANGTKEELCDTLDAVRTAVMQLGRAQQFGTSPGQDIAGPRRTSSTSRPVEERRAALAAST